jgi:hypothetical protein
MIHALFRRIFYADAPRGPSRPETDNRREGSMFPDPRDEVFARYQDARRRNDTRGQAEAAAENRAQVMRTLRLGRNCPIHPENRK